MIERIRRELTFLFGALRTLAPVTRIAKNPNRTFPDVAEDLARTYGDRVALISDGEQLTFSQYNQRANQYARWALANGIEKGDCVALFMPNRPEYMAIWLGFARAGAVVALLNTNLRGAALAHCIDLVDAKFIVVDGSLVDGLATSEGHIGTDPTTMVHGEAKSSSRRIDTEIAEFDTENVPRDQLPELTTSDRCLYIYTSGTTGLPKAANINHYRTQAIMFAFSAAMKLSPEDRMYVCLPLYHTTGCAIATGGPLVAGASVFIRDRFSASRFWDDVVDNNCTVFEYIGELCRYLLNSPTHAKENQHRLRLACGNGLRPDIWEDFQTRFHIPQILEWYAATEGNAVLFNFDGKPGAVGRIPKWAENRLVSRIVRFDLETETPIRGADGHMIACEPGEVGEVISKIVNDPYKPGQRFEGYSKARANDAKILKDVFEKGDMWFRTGDLMRKDRQGYFYFVDRVGDTFRWKGENVSTSEVSEAMTVFPGIKDSNVYGVKVPGHDGRAGMAAIVVEDDFDLDGLRAHLHNQLPSYALPLFLRIQSAIDITGTFKQHKIKLVQDGYDLNSVPEPVYFDHPDTESYVRLDEPLAEAISGGGVRI